MFAGSCIGFILLVMVLEGLRRLSREYDQYLLRNHAAQSQAHRDSSAGSEVETGKIASGGAFPDVSPFTPNVIQQAVRASIHMLQFAVAYIIMLLAMYYNGYILICIFIGAFFGSFVFSWSRLGGS